ncbi:MAG: hypothetical protein ACE37K_15720 [Planctomycetota bacterium]
MAVLDSHQQFAILGLLRSGEVPGRQVREHLQREGFRFSRPAFYALMKRMETAGYVRGSYRQKEVDGVALRERWYEIIADGAVAWEETWAFYMRQEKLRPARGGS